MRRGRTLLETLAAAVVVVLLVGLIVAIAGPARGTSAGRLARSEVAMLELAAQKYRLDHGVWPDPNTWVRDVAPYYPLKDDRVQRGR